MNKLHEKSNRRGVRGQMHPEAGWSLLIGFVVYFQQTLLSSNPTSTVLVYQWYNWFVLVQN